MRVEYCPLSNSSSLRNADMEKLEETVMDIDSRSPNRSLFFSFVTFVYKIKDSAEKITFVISPNVVLVGQSWSVH